MRALWICGLSIFFVACSATGPADGALKLIIEGDVTLAAAPGDSVDLTLPFAYLNGTDNTVFVPKCDAVPSPTLEHDTGNGWHTVWSMAADFCLGEPLRIQAGSVYRDVMVARVDRRLLPARFRLMWHVLTDYEAETYPQGPLVDETGRASAAFEIQPQ